MKVCLGSFEGLPRGFLGFGLLKLWAGVLTSQAARESSYVLRSHQQSIYTHAYTLFRTYIYIFYLHIYYRYYYICVHIYICIYNVMLSLYTYIYIHIYVYLHIHIYIHLIYIYIDRYTIYIARMEDRTKSQQLNFWAASILE